MNKSHNVLVFTEGITKRKEYIFSFLLSDILGVGYSFEEDLTLFTAYNGPKINYSQQEVDGVLQFVPHGLLNENHIKQPDRLFFGLNDFESLSSNKEENTFLFDPFAAAFYLVTRYEEYLSECKDKYGRFPAEESSAFHEGFLDRPVIDQWAYMIGGLLESIYQDFNVSPRKFSFLNTIDIDNAYAYKGKGFGRNMGGFVKSLIQGRFKDAVDRIKVLTDNIEDPYDTYGYILKTCSDISAETIIFFLLGNYGSLDKNLSHDSPELQKLIQGLGRVFPLGLHPSYASNMHQELLEIEYNRLKNAINSDDIKSRQHYLVLDLPVTYDRLDSIGVKHEFSMGYPDKIGFRASTCTTFNFFNLDKNRETGLLIYPFCIMDITLKDYLHLSRSESTEVIDNMVEKVEEVGGNFISIWHNESLSDKGEWIGWRFVYEKMLGVLKEKQNSK